MTAAEVKSTDDDVPAPRPAGRRLRSWIVLLTGITLLPSLVTVTGIGVRGLSWFHPELASVTEFTDLKLHWWAPVECSDLRIHNTREWSREAPPLLTAKKLTTEQSLWQVVWNLGRHIRVTVTEPELNLINSDAGSNLADAFEDLSSAHGSSDSGFPCEIVVRDGRISLATAHPDHTSPDDDIAWTVEQLVTGIQCDISTLDTNHVLPNVSLTATLGEDQRDTEAAADDSPVRSTTMHPRVAARLDELASVPEPLRLRSPHAPGRSARQPSIRIKLGPMEDSSQRALRFDARALELDVLEPLIAQMIPGVRCRGLLSLQGEALLLGPALADGFAFRAAARAADCRCRMSSWESGETLNLSTASADCAIAVARDGIVVHTLSASCPFASLTGDGEIRLPAEQILNSILKSAQIPDVGRRPVITEAATAAAGQINIRGQVDLVPISRMLPRTLNLRDGLQLTEGSLQLAVRTQAPGPSDTELPALDWLAVIESSPLAARHGNRTIRWDAPVRLQCTGPVQMAAAELRSARLSGDFGQIQALPLDDALEIHGRLDLDRLWSRLGQFIDHAPPGVRGEVEVDAWVGLPASGDVLLRDVKVRAANLRMESEHLTVHRSQPLLKMLDGQLSMTGSGGAVRSLVGPWTDLSWVAPESQISVQLDAAPPHRLTVVGEIRPGQTASRSHRGQHSSPSLSIDRAQLALDIDTDSQPDHYIIRRGQLHLPGVDAQLSGTVETAGEWMTTQLEVAADYDLAVLSRLALNDPEEKIRLWGQQQSRFVVHGTPVFHDGAVPADAEPLEVTGQVGWDAADIDGLQLGPGQAPFRLTAEQLQTEPIRCSLNGGNLTAMINYDLHQRQLSLASGSRVENIVVDEEVARRWLGYVAPLLADAAHVQGSVSARVNQFSCSLDHPETSEISGTVDIHGITASPGSALSVLLQGLDALRPDRRSLVRDLAVPRQQVQCALRDGVITHDQLLLTLSGYSLKSRGTVGLNRQINLVLDIPLERAGDQRPGQSVSVPVQGSVDRPQIDIAGLLQNAGTQRIQGEINDQLNRGLNRLFDRLR